MDTRNLDLLELLDEDSTVFTLDSKYISPGEVCNLCNDIPSSSTNLTVMHLNIQGLSSKTDHLSKLVMDFNSAGLPVHVIMLCETFLTDTNISMCHIPGYNLVHRNRIGSARGGVAMYISDVLSFKLMYDYPSVDTEFETIAVEVLHRNKSFYFAELYRVPNTNETLSIDRYNECFNYFRNKRNVFIGTDQNFDLY